MPALVTGSDTVDHDATRLAFNLDQSEIDRAAGIVWRRHCVALSLSSSVAEQALHRSTSSATQRTAMQASTLIVVHLFAAASVVLARLPFCEWCKYEDDQEQLFSWCVAQQFNADGDSRILFAESRCHDAWRFALATRVIVNVELTEAFGDGSALLMELDGGVRALYRDACVDDGADLDANYYFDLVAHQVDRALGLHRVPPCQLRQLKSNVLLAIPGLSAPVRARIAKDRDNCAKLQSRLRTNRNALFGLMIGLPALDAIVRAPPLPLQLARVFQAGELTDATALDSLELTRHLVLLHVIGDLDRLLDNTSAVETFVSPDGVRTSLFTDLRSSRWSSSAPLLLPAGVEPNKRTVFPQQCQHASDGRCQSLQLAALRAEAERADDEHRAVTLARWLGELLSQLCRFPRDVAQRVTTLHTDSMRPGVFVAHAVKEVLPDMDEAELVSRWADRTAYANAAIDKRVRSVHEVVNLCVAKHGASDVLIENAERNERRLAQEHRVSAWVRDKHARYEDPKVREAHLAEYAAPRYTDAAEERRLKEALLLRAHASGHAHDDVDRECREFGELVAGAQFVASNGKKIVFRLANESLALKHSVASAAVEHKEKTAWKVYRVPEKQRRDLLYERWVLQRLARVDGVVRLHASADLSACVQAHLSSMGVVNIVDFVPRRLGGPWSGGSECTALGLAVQGAELLVAFERGDAAIDSSIFMSDWKSDNFGVSGDGRRLVLFDVDSIEFYARNTRYLWQKYCDVETERDVRNFKTDCMQLGSFRNSMRAGDWPAELFCNATTRLCDGFDSLSNVWGFCSAVLPAILGSEPYSRSVHASLPQREQLVAILARCTSRERLTRPSPAALLQQLLAVRNTACA